MTTGMPSVNITFSEAAKTIQSRANTGTVGLILRDTVPETNPIVATQESDIPKSLSDANKLQIQLALKGVTRSPQKVVAYVIATAAENYDDAFGYFDTCIIDFLAVPTAKTDNKIDTIKTWVTKARADGQIVEAILPSTAADMYGIINFTTAELKEGDTTYTTEQYCSRIAGMLASIPLSEASTYKSLPELTGCTKLTKLEMDNAIDAGELIVFWDGEKVKVARGVNSYKTVSETAGEQFKKIKVVRTMDVIQADIKRISEDSYLGQYSNTYDNKMVLVGAVGDYLKGLESQNLIELKELDLDIQAIKKYLVDAGTYDPTMTDTDIKMAPTGSKVFAKATIKIYDAIEDIELPIVV